jgi:hypothetical protein
VSHNLVCWKCGTSLAHLSLPLRRLDERVAKHCREPTAEEVSNKTQANFCDHFKPREGAYIAPKTAEMDKAKAELENLFGKK